jgi:hypothetical protein
MEVHPIVVAKRVIRLIMPPVVVEVVRLIWNRWSRPILEYAPRGWETMLSNRQNTGWNLPGGLSAAIIERITRLRLAPG